MVRDCLTSSTKFTTGNRDRTPALGDRLGPDLAVRIASF
jgi:hypothetical protein